MQKEQIPEDEIDFEKIGNGLWKFIAYPAKLLLTHLVTTSTFLIVSILLSIGLKYMMPKLYKSTFIIRPIEKNERIHVKVLNDLEFLRHLNDKKSLSRELNLDESVVEAIDNIEITNYAFSKNKADSSNTTAVEITVSDNSQIIPIQNAILSYLEESPYFKKIKEIMKQSIALRSTMVNSDLLLLDSLKKLQLSSYDKLKINEQNAVLLKDAVNPTSTYTLSLERMNQKAGLLYQSEFINNFQLVKAAVVPEKSSWPPRLLILFIITCPVFMFFCFIYLHFKTKRAKQN